MVYIQYCIACNNIIHDSTVRTLCACQEATSFIKL